MPRPVESSTSYMPGLDGVRALAVIVVVGYHLGVQWMQGGLLGVGAFFKLSGFLITSLLLDAWERDGGLGLRTFWLRRARRLLPALILVLAVVLSVTALVDSEQIAQRWRESLGALLFVSNWQTINDGVSYFDRVGGPGPLDHLWSLAVEEQFYLLWPLVLALALRLTAGRWTRLAKVSLVLAGISFVAMAVLAQPGFDNTRVYEGTDTRAGGLLIGAALAFVWRPGVFPRLTLRGRFALDVVGLIALAAIGYLVASTNAYSVSLYYGGLLALSVATTVLVGAVSHPSSWLGRLLGVAPLRWIGERSYGIYLWHLPVIVFTPATVLPESPWVLATGQVLITLVLASLSWSLVEDPIRRHGYLRAFGLRRPQVDVHLGLPTRGVLTGILVCVFAGTSVLAASARVADQQDSQMIAAELLEATITTETSPAPASPTPSKATAPSPSVSASPTLRPESSPATSPEPTEESDTSEAAPDGQPTDTTVDSSDSSPTDGAGSSPLTSCSSVVHVGDSTSLGLMDPAYQPDPRKRVDRRYAQVGVDTVITDISGARSIVERYEDQPNAEEAVVARMATGYDGCWVLAMGNNEVANQYVGGVVPLGERIDLLMRHLGDQPVMWLTTTTLVPNGPYAGANMPAWTDALGKACKRYPNMRVYDWASDVRPQWFIPDGIHYSTDGYAKRARYIATALATAFPQDRPPLDRCMVTAGG